MKTLVEKVSTRGFLQLSGAKNKCDVPTCCGQTYRHSQTTNLSLHASDANIQFIFSLSASLARRCL